MKVIKVRVSDANFQSVKVGQILVFKDGEEWKVAPSSKISTHGYLAPSEKEVSIKPFNDLAKKNNISLAVPIDESYFKKNVLKVK